MINENKCTIGWSVYKDNVSHMDDIVNSNMEKNIEERFGKLSHNTGNKRTLLGMDIGFIGGNKVALTTPHHI